MKIDLLIRLIKTYIGNMVSPAWAERVKGNGLDKRIVRLKRTDVHIGQRGIGSGSFFGNKVLERLRGSYIRNFACCGRAVCLKIKQFVFFNHCKGTPDIIPVRVGCIVKASGFWVFHQSISGIRWKLRLTRVGGKDRQGQTYCNHYDRQQRA